MAYNTFYPAVYQPNYYNPMGGMNPYQQNYQNYQQMQNPQQSQQAQNVQPMQQQPIQQNGFVPVRSEQEARNYPVAPGNAITFKDENAPYCYVKAMGFNQLDQPTFERYRLVKEDTPLTAQNAPTSEEKPHERKDTAYALKGDLEAVKDDLAALQAEVKSLSAKKSVKVRKVDEAADDE